MPQTMILCDMMGYKLKKKKIIEEKSKGAWVRSRVEFAEQNEKSNAYFFKKN